nr:MAG TPA: hypothetical protein [Caudoviricetes sp.]DAT89700.1 MAG TPA: hypothetical protein [Caudoviricetes sp.]
MTHPSSGLRAQSALITILRTFVHIPSLSF